MVIAICDDEKAIWEQIRRLIEKQRADADIICYQTGEELLAAGRHFDIIFLEINIDGKSGIETARVLQRQQETILIFITELKEYVFDAFDVGAFHYLLKPLSEEKFAEVFERAMRRVQRCGNQELFPIRRGNRNIMLRRDQILYVESRMRKAEIHTGRESYEIYGTMNELERSLGEGFYRCHRGYLVNLAYVMEYTTDTISLTDGTVIYLSREKYNAFVNAYMRYLQGGGISHV